MTRWMLAALAALTVSPPAAAGPADPEHAAVIAAAQEFFDSMAANDAKRMGDITLPDTMYASVQPNADGTARLRQIPRRQFLERAPGGDKYLERMWDPVVTRRGPLAVIWAPYEFQLNGKTTHCGVDVFNMVKADGAWKVASLSWTAEPNACAELKAKPRR